MLVIGAKEVEEKTVAVRDRKQGDAGTMPLTDFIKKAVKETEEKYIEKN